MNTITKLQLLLFVIILGFLTGPRVMLALQKLTPPEPGSPNSAVVVGTSVTVLPPTPTIPSVTPFEKLDLKAKSVYVWDINAHRKLYGKNEHAQFPLASVTKMMMAVVAKELLPPDTKITIRPFDLREEGDSGLYAGEIWKLDQLLDFTLVSSSNDGASAIAGVAGATLQKNASSSDPLTNKKLFIEKMNEKARAIGLENTYFNNESGLDVESLTSGAYGSARDMAMLFEYVLRKHPELFTPTTYAHLDLKSENNIVHHVANTNEEVARIAGIIGSKTGYTDLAGGNLVVVVDIGISRPVVIAVLGSTREGRFTDVASLISASVASFEAATSTPARK